MKYNFLIITFHCLKANESINILKYKKWKSFNTQINQI